MSKSSRVASRRVSPRSLVCLAAFALLGLLLAEPDFALGAPESLTPVHRFLAQSDPLAKPNLGPGWIGFAATYRLVRPTAILIHGKRSGGGCDFAVPMDLAPGSPSIEGRERAVNVKTCTFLDEVGVAPSREPSPTAGRGSAGARTASVAAPGDGIVDAAPTVDPTDYTEPGYPQAVVGTDGGEDPCWPVITGQCTAGAGPVTANPPSPTAPSLPLHYRQGGLHSWFDDPVDIVVNAVKNSLDFHYDGTAIRGTVNSYESTYWAGVTGWAKDADKWSHGFNPTVQIAYSTSYVKYTNYAFCAGIRAHAWYNNNMLHGYRNGHLHGVVHWHLQGGCVKLLSFHHRLEGDTASIG